MTAKKRRKNKTIVLRVVLRVAGGLDERLRFRFRFRSKIDAVARLVYFLPLVAPLLGVPLPLLGVPLAVLGVPLPVPVPPPPPPPVPASVFVPLLVLGPEPAVPGRGPGPRRHLEGGGGGAAASAATMIGVQNVSNVWARAWNDFFVNDDDGTRTQDAACLLFTIYPVKIIKRESSSHEHPFGTEAANVDGFLQPTSRVVCALAPAPRCALRFCRRDGKRLLDDNDDDDDGADVVNRHGPLHRRSCHASLAVATRRRPRF